MLKVWVGNDKIVKNRNGKAVIVAVKVNDYFFFVHGNGQNKMSFHFSLN